MIKHIVMWTLKEEALGKSGAENAAEMKRMLETLEGKIPGLLHLEVGTDVFNASPAWQVVLYSEFATRADLAAYQPHPEHQKCVQFISQVVSGRGVLDYEV
ncbi:Dabb family protein [Desulfovibrio aminophilus]|nr:Dabb family protein [Desulfovibrio aminophilus]MCM0754844.1 Dabb family protein [Desulfovibrio aminophilus]